MTCISQSIRIRFKTSGASRDCYYLPQCLPGKLVRLVGYSLVLLIFLTVSAHSQPISTCNDGSLSELKSAIYNHNQHSYRLDKKFKDVWYPLGEIPAKAQKEIELEDIKKYLTMLGKRKSAVLFHGVNHGRLRTWLFTYRGEIICATPKKLTSDDWKTLQPNSWSELGIRGAKHPRLAIPLDNGEQISDEEQNQIWDTLLHRLSDILLPHEVVQELETSKIDTLIVVPITVRKFIYSDIEETSATHAKNLNVPSSLAALAIGVVPFAALPIGNDVLINRMSVLISPGFFLFTQNPETERENYINPIIVGNPVHQRFQNLPGAEAEAKHIASILHTDQIFVREKATKAALKSYVEQYANSVDFIHLATHGVADSVNPVDESFLVFSDGLWNAREISRLRRQGQVIRNGKQVIEDLPMLQAKPLVVMSACQTALGKDFPAGTIGLARAWHWAGASNVIMSLWSVDDQATKELMVRFVEYVISGKAVDKALQSAMLDLRSKYPSPSNWASFSVYGAPERVGIHDD